MRERLVRPCLVRALGLALASMFVLFGCSRHCAPVGPDPFASYDQTGRKKSPMRLLGRREIASGRDAIAQFTRASQWSTAGVDFEKEQVLRVTVRASSNATIAWVIDDASNLVVAVDARGFRCASGGALQQIDVAVQRSNALPHLVVKRDDDAGCDPPTTACELPTWEKPPASSKPVAYRAVTGEAQATASHAVFNDTWGFKGDVDFAKERVVHLRASDGFSISWIAETEDEVIVSVGTTRACTAYPPPQQPPLDVALPQSTKPIRVVSHSTGPSCQMNGQP